MTDVPGRSMGPPQNGAFHHNAAANAWSDLDVDNGLSVTGPFAQGCGTRVVLNNQGQVPRCLDSLHNGVWRPSGDGGLVLHVPGPGFHRRWKADADTQQGLVRTLLQEFPSCF